VSRFGLGRRGDEPAVGLSTPPDPPDRLHHAIGDEQQAGEQDDYDNEQHRHGHLSLVSFFLVSFFLVSFFLVSFFLVSFFLVSFGELSSQLVKPLLTAFSKPPVCG
jgi:hypothetical protein